MWAASEMAGDRNCCGIGLSGLVSSILRGRREAHLPLTAIANVVLLSSPDFVTTTGFSIS
jgi:hypothetical protein